MLTVLKRLISRGNYGGVFFKKTPINPYASIITKRYCSDNSSQLNIDEITGGDEKLEHKFKVLQLEAEVWRQEGRLVPEDSMLTESNWTELLKLETISARRRYYEFLFKTCKKRENQLAKKEQKRLEREGRLSQRKEVTTFEEFVTTYDLQHNNMFLRFYDSTMNQMYNNRLIQAIQYGQKLVVDCGYDRKMTTRENINCAKQLMLLFAENRYHIDPFDLHYCNANPDSVLIQSLQRHIPQLYETWFPLNIHKSSYLNHFPRQKLVYLTPHCREELTEYDHDAVYIIGGIVDKVKNEPLSLAKAKEEGLRMAKLPLDRYLQWGSGSGKNLTLNQVVSILLDMKHTGDWEYALRHVPRRKLLDESEIQLEKPQFKPRKSVWTPSANINFNRETVVNKKTNQERVHRESLLRVRSLMDE